MNQQSKNRVNNIIGLLAEIDTRLKTLTDEQQKTVVYWKNQGEKAEETFNLENKILISLYFSNDLVKDALKSLNQITNENKENSNGDEIYNTQEIDQ